jgi:hypothetical protein
MVRKTPSLSIPEPRFGKPVSISPAEVLSLPHFAEAIFGFGKQLFLETVCARSARFHVQR